MKNITKTTVCGLLFCLLAAPGLQMNVLQNLSAGELIAAPAIAGCRCKACRGGKVKKRCIKCPKCDADVCQLKCEKQKIKKTCYEVDQKVVCIPKITFPWQKCCNKCAKTRTVKVLGIKEYECKECKYTWSLHEPDLPPSSETGPELPDFEPAETPNQPKLESPTNGSSLRNEKLYDPSGSDVPSPPVTRRINN